MNQLSHVGFLQLRPIDFIKSLPTQLRVHTFLLMPAIFIVALLELISVGIAVPFFSIMISPAATFQNETYQDIYRLMAINSESELLTVAASIFCVVVAVSAMVRLLLLYYQTSLAFKIGTYLGCSIYETSLWQSYETAVSNSSNEVIATISYKVERVIREVILGFFMLISSVVSIVAIFGTLAYIDYKITFAIAAAFGVTYFSIRRATRRYVVEHGHIVARKSSDAIRIAREGYLGFKDIVLTNSQLFYGSLFKESFTKFKRSQVILALIGSIPRYVVEGVVLVAVGATVLLLSRSNSNFLSAIPYMAAFGLAAVRVFTSRTEPIREYYNHQWRRDKPYRSFGVIRAR